ncbi:polycystin-2 isoform X2 [Callorhinchus milii]|uniref:polycystin-2 isoform X2 n=1 Tax=Callorhinchus milii TaxID=7868 RepID=UPI001C3FF298|nr:polycystin-2 isoform X2 [Callorhinchus milii]
MVNSNMYFFTKVMSNLFLETKSSAQLVNFKKIRSMEDFWEFAEGPLLDSLYWKEWYDGQPLSSKESYIYYENILLGVPQIRQVRVRNNTCSVLKYFRDTFKDCFNEYSLANEDHSAFGLQTGSEWEYTVPNSQFELRHWGKISKYRNGGYILDLDRQKEESAKKIKHLKSNLWLDLGSRAVFIDFSVYNANVNLFCALRLLVEFPATGGATTSWHIYTVKLLRYVSTLDYFLGACEILFCLFILNYLGQELIEMYELKLRYFQSFWNCLDFLIVLLSLLAIVFSIYRTAKVSLVLEKLLENSFKYPNLYFLAYWQNQYNNMIAITVFIAWIKLGYLIFGAQVESFHTFSNCIFTQFRIILGDFNFAEIEKANRILGPIYFTTFVFCIFFVLLNVFLAIINETYAEVKGNRSLRKIDFDISDLIKKHIDRCLIRFKLKKAPTEVYEAIESKAEKEKEQSLQDDEKNENKESAQAILNDPCLEELGEEINQEQHTNTYYGIDNGEEYNSYRDHVVDKNNRISARSYHLLIVRTEKLEYQMNCILPKVQWIVNLLRKIDHVKLDKLTSKQKLVVEEKPDLETWSQIITESQEPSPKK